MRIGVIGGGLRKLANVNPLDVYLISWRHANIDHKLFQSLCCMKSRNINVRSYFPHAQRHLASGQETGKHGRNRVLPKS